jgi:hypothetical protein
MAHADQPTGSRLLRLIVACLGCCCTGELVRAARRAGTLQLAALLPLAESALLPWAGPTAPVSCGSE